MNVVLMYAALCGILSAVTLGAISALGAIGVLVPFVPLLPVLWVGLTRGVIPLAFAAAVAFVLSFLVVSAENALLFGITELVASVVFVRELMKLEVDEINKNISWAPVGHAFIGLSLAACVIIGLVMAFAPDGFTDALASIQRDLNTELPQMDPQIAAQFKQVIEKIPHVFLALELWVWGLLLYGFTALVNFAAVSYRRAIRPSLQIKSFYPPTFFFIMLMLSCLISFMQAGSLSVFAQMLCIVLFFPYFISGLSHIQQRILTWSYAQVWLTCFYCFMIFTTWPIFFITLYGVVDHSLQFWKKGRPPTDMA